MLVDAHCHLVGKGLDKETLRALLTKAKGAGVGGFIAVATDFEDSPQVLALAREYPEIRASLGMHPHEAEKWEALGACALEALAQDPLVCFIGETGLDGHYNFSSMAAQELAFREQIRLALRVKKPLMIHTREAAADTLRILEEEKAGQVGGVIHCFSEDRTFAEKALGMGFYFSFSGILTFKNTQAIQDVARWAPMDRILVETDSPYLAPVPHRGKTNEPAFVLHVAKCLAGLRGVTLEEISEQTTRNLETLCGWHPSS